MAKVTRDDYRAAGRFLPRFDAGRFDFTRKPVPAKRTDAPPPETLHDFIRAAWHIVEPGRALIGNWHIDAIADHLTAVRDGQIRRLLINIPPGHSKSLLVSVFFPAWMWSHSPQWRVLTGSYANDLALRDAVKARSILESNWFAETYRPTWRLSGDQNVKSYYANSERGFRGVMSVGGKTTGHRADAVVIDDPLSVMDSYSAAKREEACRWIDQAASNRLSDMRTGAIVLMMQRVHEKDPSGHILAQGGYEHLCLPSLFDPARRATTSIGWSDPRTTAGELLFPEMFPQEVLDGELRRLGQYGFSGQHQQAPAPDEGGIFKADSFPIVKRPPVMPKAVRVRRWDLAATTKGGDYTVGLLMAFYDDAFWIEDVVRVQLEPGARNQTIRATAELDKTTYGTVTTIVPRDPGSAGIDTVITLKSLLRGFPVGEDRETQSKETRARSGAHGESLAAQASIGRVRLYEAPWNAAFIEEAKMFPHGAHDDMIDAAVGAFSRLIRQMATMTKPSAKANAA